MSTETQDGVFEFAFKARYGVCQKLVDSIDEARQTESCDTYYDGYVSGLLEACVAFDDFIDTEIPDFDKRLIRLAKTKTEEEIKAMLGPSDS